MKKPTWNKLNEELDDDIEDLFINIKLKNNSKFFYNKFISVKKNITNLKNFTKL